MTLSQIQYFLTAARCLNFTTAAKELYMSQPALGRQISALEEELNVKLFVRGKNTLKLTPVGSMLKTEFTDLMVRYNSILQKVYAMGSDDSVVIRIGMLEGYGLGDMIPRFLKTGRRDYPELMIDLTTDSYGELTRRLEEGSLDLAITFAHDVKDRPDLLLHPLCDVPLYYAYHASAVDTAYDPAVQEDHLLILNSPEDSAASFARDRSLYEQMNVVWRYKMARDINEQLFFVRQGYGCALLAGNCNIHADSSIVFEKRPGLPDAHLVAVWNIHTANPAIPLCLTMLDQLIAKSQDIISAW